MNERIKELAEQAGLQPFEDCGPGYVYKMEKFAELIVRKCASIALKSGSVPNKKEVAVAEADRIYHKINIILVEPHTCPYAEEICGDYETLCTCTEEQEYQCRMDI